MIQAFESGCKNFKTDIQRLDDDNILIEVN
jgi:hypothetical protein